MYEMNNLKKKKYSPIEWVLKFDIVYSVMSIEVFEKHFEFS